MRHPRRSLGLALAIAACATSAPAPEDAAGAADADDTVSANAARAPSEMAGRDLQPADSSRRGMDPGPVRERMRQAMHPGMEGRMHRGMSSDRRGMHGDSAGTGMRHGTGMQMHRDSAGARMRRRMGMHGEGGSEPGRVPERFQEGKRIYDQVCSACHTMDPPPDLAPPMSHVARHLRQSFEAEDLAVAHVQRFLPAPSRENSILPDMPHHRFGLMPPQPLPPEMLEAVGRYLWFLGGGS